MKDKFSMSNLKCKLVTIYKLISSSTVKISLSNICTSKCDSCESPTSTITCYALYEGLTIYSGIVVFNQFNS